MGSSENDNDFASLLRRRWPLVAAIALLIAFGGLYVQRKLAEPKPGTVSTAAPEKPATTPGDARKDEGKEADAANPPAAETPMETVASQTVDVSARPAFVVKGQAKWDDAQKTIVDGIAKARAAATKSGASLDGRPLTVFTETDDKGFHYEVMAPLAKAPESKTGVEAGVEIGLTPAGKALKFQHRGSYDEIDATYEAVTAYLDEKGLDTKNVFAEEYLNDLKDGEDPNLEVDIYVFLK